MIAAVQDKKFPIQGTKMGRGTLWRVSRKVCGPGESENPVAELRRFAVTSRCTANLVGRGRLMSVPQSYEVSLLDEERYRLLVDSITDYAIYMIDPNGKIVSWNPGAQRFKGYEAWEILGEHFSRFYTPE